MRTNARLVKTV